MSYRERVDQDRRLVILRVLSEQPDYQLNDRLVSDALDVWGHRVGREQLRQYLHELEELAAVKLTPVGDGPVLIAEITRRGLDHVERRVTIEGVKRPGPGS